MNENAKKKKVVEEEERKRQLRSKGAEEMNPELQRASGFLKELTLDREQRP